MINLSIPEVETQMHPRIMVVGVGGAGGNAVNNMIRSNLEGVEFLVCNSDAQALAGSVAERKIQLGTSITQGLGAGSRPEVGRAAAEEALDQINGHLEGSHMVFITAGMGGGTGTGAAPVIARAAREMGMLTVGVVTKPFHFEGTHRMRIAEAGLQELHQFVDTLIVIPNQNLFRIANEKTTFADAFKMADDVLHSGVRGVTDLMVMPGLINLDFADIRSVMSEMGKAMMGTGEAEGERRSIGAAEAAISNPLLDDVSMKGARGVLINITGGLDMTLYEVDEAANQIRDEVDPDANIIFGSTFDPTMEGRIRVSVVATGIDLEAPRSRSGVANLSVVGDQSRMAVRGMGGDTGNPGVPQKPAVSEPAAAAAPVSDPNETMEAPTPGPAISERSRPEAVAPGPPRAGRHEGAFIPPSPVQPASRPQHSRPVRAGEDPFGDPDLSVSGHSAAEPARKRAPGLFRRMTGLLRDDYEEPAAVQYRAEPAPQPQPRMGEVERPRPQPQPLNAMDVRGRPPLPRHDDDQLDIPAFLRRQAN